MDLKSIFSDSPLTFGRNIFPMKDPAGLESSITRHHLNTNFTRSYDYRMQWAVLMYRRDWFSNCSFLCWRFDFPMLRILIFSHRILWRFHALGR